MNSAGTTIASANLIVEAGGEVAEVCVLKFTGLAMMMFWRQVAVITAIAFFKGWKNFRNSLPALAKVPIFSIVEAGSTPCMPDGEQMILVQA